MWVNLTQVLMNDKDFFTTISNNPAGKASDVNGCDANVKGGGDLHVLPQTVNIGHNYALHYVTN